jgi:P27 family predicted phage terminase small subunit
MGRRPIPTHTLKLRGSELLAQRVGEPEGDATGAATMFRQVLACEIARRYFDRLVQDLRGLGLYAAEDYVSHNHYALAAAEWEKAQELVESEGMTIITPQGKIQNPALKVRDNARAEVARLCREFGLSPASRVGLQSSKKKGNAASAIESILKAKTA